MKSDIIHVKASGAGVSEALAQTEAVAVYRGLSHKDSLRLRLLAEEMMGLIQGITGERDAEFYIEAEENKFQLHLSTITRMNAEMREKLMDTSTSGRNAAAVGFLGKLRDLFESAYEPLDAYTPVYFTMGVEEEGMNPMGLSAMTWTLSHYRNAVKCAENTEAKEAWDELERSVIANAADEVEIGIKGERVEMTVYKTF